MLTREAVEEPNFEPLDKFDLLCCFSELSFNYSEPQLLFCKLVNNNICSFYFIRLARRHPDSGVETIKTD